MYLQKVISRKTFFISFLLASVKDEHSRIWIRIRIHYSEARICGSRSGSTPNVMDPQHCKKVKNYPLMASMRLLSYRHFNSWKVLPPPMKIALSNVSNINGTPTKRQVSKRQVSKRQVSKRQVSKRQVSKRPVLKRLKRQVYRTSGLQNVRFTKRQVFKTSGCKKTSIYILYLWLVEIRRFCCSHVCRHRDGPCFILYFRGFFCHISP
jgi:hypothetical protein